MTQWMRRTIAVALLAVSMAVGIGSTASAGELCGRLRVPDPLNDLRICAPTNV